MNKNDYEQKHTGKPLDVGNSKSPCEEVEIRKTYKFEDFATKEDKKIAREALKWNIPDEDLFE